MRTSPRNVFRHLQDCYEKTRQEAHLAFEKVSDLLDSVHKECTRIAHDVPHSVIERQLIRFDLVSGGLKNLGGPTDRIGARRIGIVADEEIDPSICGKRDASEREIVPCQPRGKDEKCADRNCAKGS